MSDVRRFLAGWAVAGSYAMAVAVLFLALAPWPVAVCWVLACAWTAWPPSRTRTRNALLVVWVLATLLALRGLNA